MKTANEHATFPELKDSPVSCNSWIIKEPGGVLFETFSDDTARMCFKGGWYVVTAYQHLVTLKRPAAS